MDHQDQTARHNPYASPLTDASADPAECDALIRIRRASRFQDWTRAYRVILNGRVVGAIRNGQTKEVAVHSGACELVVKLDWCGSETVAFDLRPEETLSFECASRFRGLGFLLAPFYIVFLWRRYLILRRV